MYVATFYSFKGGVGRTLALLNVAYELADSGLKILVVDFDLEAPAIHADRWSRPTSAVSTRDGDIDSGNKGIVEYVGEYLRTMRAPNADGFIVDATPEGCNGTIALMPSGVLDDSYGRRLNEIDWNDLYLMRDGYVMFEDLRAQWEALGFDYVLLDSRTGFTDVGGICTRHLPDAAVLMFRPDDQSLRGMESVVEAIRKEEPTPRREGPVALHFVMAAIPDADDEDGILEQRRATFQQRLDIPSGRLLEIRHYQSMDLLTQPVYTDVRPRTKLARSFQQLTKRIRALNIGDRDGVLGYLQEAGRWIPDPQHEDFLDRIRWRYNADPHVLGELADAHSSRGMILEAAELLERIAELGTLTPVRLMELAKARHFFRDFDGALGALKSFFQDPWDGSPKSDRRRYNLVRRGLGLLETLGADRVAYVESSPIVQGLSPAARASLADHLDLSPGERRVATRILEDVLSGEEGSTNQRSHWKWNLAFARMAVGNFAKAIDAFGDALAEPQPHIPVPTAFNLAMAMWGESGVTDSTAFAGVLDHYDAEDDKDWLESDPNKLQALAVAEWFGGRLTDATQHLADAEEVIRAHRQRSEISCWSYTRVSAARFGEHCEEIRLFFAGKDIKPMFMRFREDSSHSSGVSHGDKAPRNRIEPE